MPVITNYSPAAVLAQLLINDGVLSDIDAEGQPEGSWPVYSGHEPDQPDECVTFYATTGGPDNRNFIDGKVEGAVGFQCRVRAATNEIAYDKAVTIRDHLAENVWRKGVSIGSRYYLVHAITNFQSIIDLGSVTDEYNRNIVVFNAMVNMTDQTP